MLRLLNNPITTPIDFIGNKYLYSISHSKADNEDRAFIEYCLAEGMLIIKSYIIGNKSQIDNSGIYNDDILEKYRTIAKLKSHSQEDSNLIECLYYIYRKLKPYGDIEIDKSFLVDTVGIAIGTARLYVPEWNMAINPKSQDILDLIYLSVQQDLKICTVGYQEDTGDITGYLVERTPEFYELFSVYNAKKIKRQVGRIE